MLEYLMVKYVMATNALATSNEEGQTAVEYALVLLLVALVLVAALALGLKDLLADAINSIQSAI